MWNLIKKLKIYPLSLNTLLIMVLTLAIASLLGFSYVMLKNRLENNMIDFMQSSVLQEQYKLLSHEIENDFEKVARLTEQTAHELQSQLEKPCKYNQTELDARVKQYYEHKADGSWLTRHDNIENRHQMFSFHSNRRPPDLLSKRIMVQAVEYFGPYSNSLKEYVFNTYFTTAYISWDFGSYGWPLALDPDEDLTKHPWYYNADALNNKERKQVWTDVYFDAVNSEWMISSLFPVYVNDSFIGAVGNDILLKDIIALTKKQPYSKGYQFFIDNKGNIIAQPELGLSLPLAPSNNDTLNIKHLKDTSLNNTLQFILKQNDVGSVFSGTKNLRYLIYAPIKTLDWKLVYLVDSFNLVDILQRIFSSLALIFVLTTLFVIVLVYIIVRNFAHNPLMRLLKAMQVVKSGSSGQIIAQESFVKEVSQLIHMFNEMTTALELSEKTSKLKSSEIEQISQHLRLLNNTIPDTVLVIDQQGIILESNKTMETFTGYDNQEIKGKYIQTLFNHPSSKNLIQKLTQNNTAAITDVFETKFITKNGDLKDILIRLRPICVEPDYQLMLVLTDITDRKTIERDLKLAKEKAEHSDRLKTAFLANMSHEIRTPMNGIVGFAQLLSNQDFSDEEKENFIRIINESSQQLLHIIGEILDISKIETGQIDLKKENFAVNEFMEQLFEFFRPTFEPRKINFECKIPSTEHHLVTDKSRLNQIITNLLTNALKYTEKGSVRFGYVQKETYLEFFVSDTGIGISKEFTSAVFERFKQSGEALQKQNGGVGLGLAISKGLVEHLGGTIWVESILNEGSQFYFTIPLQSQ